ncbi:hypothetical protein GCM10009740_31620 [Terrabacter terrae]|uniref:4Fe-4S Wbl-type domain-containing protein n=1 Tax=Terrabacter terrae TaxID=318434 RepID=A0ABP5G274_9MICO
MDATPCSRVPDRDIFTSTDPDDIAAAKAVCSTCPFTKACLKAALELGEVGVWGGTTKAQRTRLNHTPRQPGRPRKPITHGTRQGYFQHRNRGEDACIECKRAASAHSKRMRASKRQAVAS